MPATAGAVTHQTAARGSHQEPHSPRLPAVQSHSLSLTTPEEQHVWGVRWWWRKCKLTAACPPARTLDGMMRRNHKALGR